jgi:hypothetical protein
MAIDFMAPSVRWPDIKTLDVRKFKPSALLLTTAEQRAAQRVVGGTDHRHVEAICDSWHPHAAAASAVC